MSDERSEGLQGGEGDSGPVNLLDLFDRVIASLPPGDPVRQELVYLRPEISNREEMILEARRMIEKLEEVVKKVTSPANRIGTFLDATSHDTAHIVVGGADYYCNVDPRISLAKLKKGTRVLVNEAFVIVGDLGFERAGPVTKITEILGKDRLRVGSEHGLQSMVLQRSADLAHSTLKSGDEVRVDSNFRMARERRHEGFMPFLFIDEAESILGTRRASRHSNILSTLVPMFCSEMDGIDSLNDVVIILASNRADLIDPAILRPGRIDRKIKVDRPNREGARDIYRIYLRNDLPYDGALAKEADNIGAAIEKLIERLVDWQFAKRDENKFLEVTLRSGRKEVLYRCDLISGAIIASVVERAKGMAIKHAIANLRASADSAVAGVADPGFSGITEQDLQMSFHAEYAENDIFPPTDITEDWLKLIDYDPEYVVKIAPVRPSATQRSANPGGVIELCPSSRANATD